MSKCLVLFVEGDTEVEFYKQVVANARKLHPAGRFDTNIEYRNVRGVGGFKSIALRKFTKEIKPKYGDDCEFTIVLCSDTDVFDFAPKPPIKWDEVKKDLANNGAAKVIHVQAKRSIEDWFLYDIEGILGFLRLGKNTKVSGKNGYDKCCVLESAIYGNATYIIPKENWEILSQKTKKELFDENKVIGKIDHTAKWKQNVSDKFKMLEVVLSK